MFVAKPITDVGIAKPEIRVLFDEVVINPLGFDDVVGDVIQNREIGLWREYQIHIRQVEAPVSERR